MVCPPLTCTSVIKSSSQEHKSAPPSPKQKETKSLIFGRQGPFAHLDLIDYMQVVPGTHAQLCTP